MKQRALFAQRDDGGADAHLDQPFGCASGIFDASPLDPGQFLGLGFVRGQAVAEPVDAVGSLAAGAGWRIVVTPAALATSAPECRVHRLVELRHEKPAHLMSAALASMSATEISGEPPGRR